MASQLHGGMSKDVCLQDVIFIFERLSLYGLKILPDADRVRQSSVWAHLPDLELRILFISLSPVWLIRVLSSYTCQGVSSAIQSGSSHTGTLSSCSL